jgi:hypothetical protein
MAIPILNLPQIRPVSESILRGKQISQAGLQNQLLRQEFESNQQKAQQQAALQSLTNASWY